MEARFTPGPWAVEDESAADVPLPGEGDIWIGTDGGGHSIAHLGRDPGLTHDQALANARLIAAAPELFALLVQITKDSPIYDDPDEGPFCTFCGAHMTYHGEAKHTADCLYIAAGALLARVQGEG